MANSLSAFSPEYWSRRTQILLRKTLVSRELANFEERSELNNGDTVHRPYYSDVAPADYTKGTAFTVQDVTATDETLVVNTSKVIPVYVDEDDMKQNKYDAANIYINRMMYALMNDMDGAFFAQTNNATLDIDDGDVGGDSGTSISLSSSNANRVFGRAYAEMHANNVEQDAPWALVVDPIQMNEIQQATIANGFSLADSTMRNGYTGSEYMGFQVYVSNNLRSSVSLGLATNPTEGDTVVINGVTFTFAASPASAGDVDIGANAAASVDNLVAAINGAAGAGTTYIALSTADRNKLTNARVAATDNTTAIGLVAAGRMTLSETLTDATDAFGTQTVQAVAMKKNAAIDMVAQIEPKIYVKPVPDKLGNNYVGHTLYGLKTFTEGAARMCKISIAA